jgi:trehalose 6-phosphate synthase/phosphatase
MDELLAVLRVYETSTPGSFIEIKRTSLVWHYRRADPEFGAWKAKQLAEELAALTANDPLHVRHGRKIIEITSSSISKGAAILRTLEERTYDLIFVAGDDQTDESMFRLDLRNLITIKVGEGDTLAHYRLPTPQAFRAFLQEAIG